MRTKKIFLNMICDIFPYLLIGIVGLVKVNFIINHIGDVGNGYYQTINQIISYVFLAQIGFGEAVIYSLYKQFAENDKRDINRIYTGSRKIFKKIGLVILGLIFIVSLCLYLFYGFEDGYRNTALISFIIISCSYLISYFGKGQTYLAILSASQNKYIYSLVFNGTKLLCDISIIFVCYKFKTLESIAIVILIAKILEEIILRIVMKNKYPWLHNVKREDTSMFKMTSDLAGAQIGNLVLNNVDSIILFIMLGPVSVSIYTSYVFITRYLNEISTKVELAIVNSFGNVFANGEDEKVYPLFKELLILFIVIAFSVCITFTLGIRGFINLWIGKENYLVNFFTITLFSIILFFRIMNLPLIAVINAKGYFKENRNHIFISAITNIIISLLLVNKYRLNGLLIGTLIAFLLNTILKINTVNKKILTNIKHKKLLISYIIIILSFIGICFILKNIEESFLIVMTNIPITLILLGGLFISLVLFLFGLSCGINKSGRDLFERIKLLFNNIVKSKIV